MPTNRTLRPQPRDDRRGERGSAFLFVLLALLVLTIVGLSLSFVTQTEAQIGGIAKSSTRAFYAADAGPGIQISLYEFAWDKGKVILDEPALSAITSAKDQVDMSPALVLYKGPCNLCSRNEGNEEYEAINFGVTSLGRRLAGAGGAENELARRIVSGMYFRQPSKEIEVQFSDREVDPSNSGDFIKAEGGLAWFTDQALPPAAAPEEE